MQDLDGAMETTVPTTAPDPSIEDNTTALNSSLLWQEFDDKENAPIPLGRWPRYLLWTWSSKAQRHYLFVSQKASSKSAHYYANPKALKELVLAEAQMSGFNVAIQGSSIVCGKHDPPTHSMKNSDFQPTLKMRKTVSS